MTGSVLQRKIKLTRKLLFIRTGPGAVILPANITRLHLKLACNNFEGNNSIHSGARKFWHMFLPQLKYHNPTVSMTVEQLKEKNSPAKMTIYYRSSQNVATNTSRIDTASSHQAPTSNSSNDSKFPTTVTNEINMKGKPPTLIMTDLLKVTNSTPVQISDKDLELQQWLEKASEISLKEAKIMRAHNEKRKKQEEMMSAARGATS